jgi:hypothetical protein
VAPEVASALILAAAGLLVVPGTAIATRRLDARRHQDALVAAAISDVFAAMAQSTRRSDRPVALERFARAKAQLVIYAPPEIVNAVLTFERSGIPESDPEARAAIVRLSEAARAASGAGDPVPRADALALLFGPDK